MLKLEHDPNSAPLTDQEENELMQYLDLRFGVKEKDLLQRFLSNYQRMKEAEKWISVKDRLPEKGEWVLVYTKALSKYVFYLNIHNEWKNQEGDVYTFQPITHWKPLPEPPKE